MPRVPDAYMKARRSEILTAAARCFARAGYRKTSMAGIAAEAGLSAGALYRYFDTKESLFQALTGSARETNAALWARAGANGGQGARLHSFVNGYFDMVGDPECRPSLALDLRLRAEALDSPVVRRELRTAYQDQLSEMAKQLRGGGKDRSGTAEARARMLIGLLNEAGVQALLIPDFDLKGYRKAVLRLVDSWTSARPPRR
ncbi:MAG: TetR/AcrR family transcriptional regulator [Alphaproteobacteria bacterium]